MPKLVWHSVDDLLPLPGTVVRVKAQPPKPRSSDCFTKTYLGYCTGSIWHAAMERGHEILEDVVAWRPLSKADAKANPPRWQRQGNRPPLSIGRPIGIWEQVANRGCQIIDPLDLPPGVSLYDALSTMDMPLQFKDGKLCE